MSATYTNTATTANSWVTITNGTYYCGSSTAIGVPYFTDDVYQTTVRRKLECGAEYELPDGSRLKIDDKGNFVVDDADARVIYRASRVREFNRFINASDLLESFIRELGDLDGVKQTEILRLPIEAFINWIILGAAKQDGDDTSKLPTVQAALPAPSSAVRPRCGCCGRFIRKSWAAARIAFCSPQHMALRLEALA